MCTGPPGPEAPDRGKSGDHGAEIRLADELSDADRDRFNSAASTIDRVAN